MNQSLLIDIDAVMPLAVATGLFVSLCTISAPANSDTGAPDGTYSPVSGLSNIVCMDAPEGLGSGLSANEAKAEAQIEAMAMRHVLLDRYYDELSPATNWGDVAWQATVDGVIYDLLGAEADSQQTQTRLRLRKVTT